eukprot:6475716-Alexandrium_andersonii.AAC.1
MGRTREKRRGRRRTEREGRKRRSGESGGRGGGGRRRQATSRTSSDRQGHKGRPSANHKRQRGRKPDGPQAEEAGRRAAASGEGSAGKEAD